MLITEGWLEPFLGRRTWEMAPLLCFVFQKGRVLWVVDKKKWMRKEGDRSEFESIYTRLWNSYVPCYIGQHQSAFNHQRYQERQVSPRKESYHKDDGLGWTLGLAGQILVRKPMFHAGFNCHLQLPAAGDSRFQAANPYGRPGLSSWLQPSAQPSPSPTTGIFGGKQRMSTISASGINT